MPRLKAQTQSGAEGGVSTSDAHTLYKERKRSTRIRQRERRTMSASIMLQKIDLALAQIERQMAGSKSPDALRKLSESYGALRVRANELAHRMHEEPHHDGEEHFTDGDHIHLHDVHELEHDRHALHTDLHEANRNLELVTARERQQGNFAGPDAVARG